VPSTGIIPLLRTDHSPPEEEQGDAWKEEHTARVEEEWD